MGLEVERKFLVRSDAWRALGEPVHFRQGYLSDTPERTVRVRLAGDQAWLTVKGMTRGVARNEYEYSIPPEEAAEMLDTLCLRPQIEKRRTRIPLGELIWEVDEFLGENAGLIVAEVELKAPDQSFDLPAWIGAEVSGDCRYFNSNLLKHPFSQWRAE